MKNRVRKLAAIGLSAVMMLSLAACTSGENASSNSSGGSETKKETEAGTGKIGVAMPTKDLQRWNQGMK